MPPWKGEKTGLPAMLSDQKFMTDDFNSATSLKKTEARWLSTGLITVLLLLFAVGFPPVIAMTAPPMEHDNYTNISWHCGPCLCNITYIDCSHRNLTGVPQNLPVDVKTLDLRFNKIESLPDRIFSNLTTLKSLLLFGNKLQNLSQDVFLGLQNLHDLDLAWNNLTLSNEAYPPGVFRPLNASLVVLLLEGNCQFGEGNCNAEVTGVNLTYPDTALSDLAMLQSLYIDGLPETSFGPSFGSMTRLNELHLRGFCSMNSLTNSTFIHLPKSVRLLNMSDCNISSIEADAFRPLDGLETLDISYNEDLGFDRLADAMYSLQGSSLNNLRINKLVHRYSMSVLITQWHTRYFKNTRIKYLSAQYNRIESFCEGALDNMPDTLEYVDLFANQLGFGRYFKDLGKLKNLKNLTVDGLFWPSPPPHSYPPAEACGKSGSAGRGCVDNWRHEESSLEVLRPDFMMDETSLRSQGAGRLTFVLPPNLTTFRSRCTQLYYQILEIHVDPNNTLQVLDLSRNMMAVWIGPITSLNLTELDLSDNFAHNVSYSFFQNLTSLRALNASRNYLRGTIENDVNGTLFEPLENLETLDLSRNYINTIPQKIFKGLRNLETLILSKNDIFSFVIDINHMENLAMLDLSYNYIHYFPQAVIDHLNNIAALPNRTVHVVLTYNPIACTCEHIDFLTWVENSKVIFNRSNNYYCMTSDGSDSKPLTNFFSMIVQLEKTCEDMTGILVGAVSCCFCLLVALASALAYRFRWKLRYLYYASRFNYRRLHADQDSFQYDAFVSYASEDNDFVHGELAERLEELAGLRLNVHNRDWTPGHPIPSNIVGAVQSSRRTLVVLTRHLLESEWCHYEMQMATLEAAYTGRDVLLFLLYEDIPGHELPREVLYNLQASTYIQYPHRQLHDDRVVNGFWQRLVQAIRD